MINTGNKAPEEALRIGLSTELWTTIEEDFDDPSEIQRPAPIGLTSTSRKLARNWKAILEETSVPQISSDHYLSDSQVSSATIQTENLEADFVIALTNFLVGRLTESLNEVREVQMQLQAELARFLPQ
jgi:hypothetical protein